MASSRPDKLNDAAERRSRNKEAALIFVALSSLHHVVFPERLADVVTPRVTEDWDLAVLREHPAKRPSNSPRGEVGQHGEGESRQHN